jgi:hypothetical protein
MKSSVVKLTNNKTKRLFDFFMAAITRTLLVAGGGYRPGSALRLSSYLSLCFATLL